MPDTSVDKEHPFPPVLDQITFRQTPDSHARLAMLMSGDAQIAQYLLPADMQWIRRHNELRLWNFQGYVIHSCPMIAKFAPLDDLRVRRALSYATPYRRIIDDVYQGFAGPAYGPLSDHAAGFDPNVSPFTYDLERARQLLRQAGHPNGSTPLWPTAPRSRSASPLARSCGPPLGTSA